MNIENALYKFIIIIIVNSVCYHTRDKQIVGRPILLSLVWLQTELDSTQSYYHY